MPSTFNSLSDIIAKKQVAKPAPAYAWQELALRVIKELSIPDFKKSAVFKVCRDLPKVAIEQCLNDTKELSQGGAAWKYFFKLTDQRLHPSDKAS